MVSERSEGGFAQYSSDDPKGEHDQKNDADGLPGLVRNGGLIDSRTNIWQQYGKTKEDN